MFRVTVMALKDEARVLGLILHKGNLVELDVLEEQRAAVQAAVDSGDIQADGFKAAAAPEKAPEKAVEKPEKAAKK